MSGDLERLERGENEANEGHRHGNVRDIVVDASAFDELE